MRLSDAQMMILSRDTARYSGTRQHISNKGSVSGRNYTPASAKTSFQQRVPYTAMTKASNIKPVWSLTKTGLTGKEPVALTVAGRIWVSLIKRGAVYPFTWNGQVSKRFDTTVESYIFPDAWPTSLEKGEDFFLHTTVVFDTAQTEFPGSYLWNVTGYSEVGDNLTNSYNVQSWSPGQSTQQVLFPPICILGDTPSPRPVVAVIGDSITVTGTSDSNPGMSLGYVSKSLDATFTPYILSRGEGMPLFFLDSNPSDYTRMLQDFQYIGCTHAYIPASPNDLDWSRTNTQIYSAMTNIGANLKTNWGFQKVVTSTMLPYTINSNTQAKYPLYRAPLNTTIRSSNGIGDGYFDASATVEDTNNTELWASGNSSDLVHPTDQGHNTYLKPAFTTMCKTLF